MKSESSQHEINEWRSGFAELKAGKPFLVRKDFGYREGDQLLVREYDEKTRRLTGTVALFTITWTTRASDQQGVLSGLLRESSVVLGLSPANVLLTSPDVRLVIEPPASPLPAVSDVGSMKAPAPAAREPCPVPAEQRRGGETKADGRPVRDGSCRLGSNTLADTLRQEAWRLRQLASAHGMDPGMLAVAIFKELAHATSLPAPNGSRASPVQPSPS